VDGSGQSQPTPEHPAATSPGLEAIEDDREPVNPVDRHQKRVTHREIFLYTLMSCNDQAPPVAERTTGQFTTLFPAKARPSGLVISKRAQTCSLRTADPLRSTQRHPGWAGARPAAAGFHRLRLWSRSRPRAPR
jgi:hypothetical protein